MGKAVWWPWLLLVVFIIYLLVDLVEGFDFLGINWWTMVFFLWTLKEFTCKEKK